MSRIHRRHFLQFAGAALAALGVSQLDLQQQSERYGQVLAQSTPRKLALLVGINAYADAPLKGCVTDVELQRQLLIHRFGFNPKDILLLTDEGATRVRILEAFEQFLIAQAKPGDVVVFHFSGHGSQVADPDCDFADCQNSTFVPVDSSVYGESAVADIMGHTLFLLMSALQTEQVTVVLDSCHSGGGTRAPKLQGNLQVRSIDRGRRVKIHPDEQAYQERWLSRLDLSAAAFREQRQVGIARGVAIAATRRNQLAADAPFSDFFAGVFTYAMTQYLWQQTGTIRFTNAVPRIASNTTKSSFTRQKPQFEIKPGSNHDQESMYFVRETTPPAEAAIAKVQGKQVEVWLGGLDPASLAAFTEGAMFSVVDRQGREQGQVKLESRRGLVGHGRFTSVVAPPGALLQERLRGIPSDLRLQIGLDPSLGEAIQAAKKALQAIQRIEPLPLYQREVQYLFGRMTPAYHQQLQQPGQVLPAVGSFGLFSPALAAIPDSFGGADETVEAAVVRLQSKLKSLLAARVVKLTLNSNASRLDAIATLKRAGSPHLLANSFTVRGGNPNSAKPPMSFAPPDANRIPIGASVQLEIVNNEARDLYVSVLSIDSAGEMTVLFPNQWTAAADVTRVIAGKTLSIPGPTDPFKLVAQPPKGISEVLIVASLTPLRQALKALRAIASSGNLSRGPVAPESPAAVIDNLLTDLDAGTERGLGVVGSQGTSATVGQKRSVRAIDTAQIAALSITFEAI